MVFQMRDIYEQQDKVNFVRRCLLKMEAQDQHLLWEVYINDSAVEVVASKMCLSRSYFYKLLHKALGSLLSIYNASCHEQTSIRARRLISEVIPYMLDLRPLHCVLQIMKPMTSGRTRCFPYQILRPGQPWNIRTGS